MAQPISYTALESDFIQSVGGTVPTFSSDQAVSFFTSTSFLYTLAFVVIVVAASYRYSVAGMLRMQATEEGIRKSKEEFKRVTYGLLGVFGLWLILATVNKDMLTGDVGLSELKATMTTNSGKYTPGQTPPTPVTPVDPETSPSGSESINRTRLANIGISINKSACVGSNTSCTNVAGLPESTLTMLEQLKNTCSGKIIVTGGTEGGHQSHGVGKTPVDISINDSSLNSCIRGFAKGPSKSYCNTTFTNFGYIFCDEKGTPHWHVYK